MYLWNYPISFLLSFKSFILLACGNKLVEVGGEIDHLLLSMLHLVGLLINTSWKIPRNSLKDQLNVAMLIPKTSRFLTLTYSCSRLSILSLNKWKGLCLIMTDFFQVGEQHLAYASHEQLNTHRVWSMMSNILVLAWRVL